MSRPPSWHPVIFFVALAGLSRAISTVSAGGSTVPAFAYLLCVLFGYTLSLVVGAGNGPRTARVLSASIGCAALVVLEVGTTGQAVPLAVVGVLYGATWVHEIAYRTTTGTVRA